MKKIYIAGPYDATNVIDVLNNIRRGIRAATEFMKDGYAVYCPFLDFQMALSLRDGESIPKEVYQQNSIAWVEHCDVIYVLKGSENSGGVRRELIVAQQMGKQIIHER